MKTFKSNSGIVKGYVYNQNDHVLDITTYDGLIYQYYDVPENTMNEFLGTDQPGIFYKNVIRKKYKRMCRSSA